MDKQKILVKSTVPFKLKDKNERFWKAFNLKSQFGFIPETVIVSKPHGMNNIFTLSAVLTPEEVKKSESIKTK